MESDRITLIINYGTWCHVALLKAYSTSIYWELIIPIPLGLGAVFNIRIGGEVLCTSGLAVQSERSLHQSVFWKKKVYPQEEIPVLFISDLWLD